MLKKKLSITLLSFAVSAVYADAPVMISVKGDMSNQPFHIDHTQSGYQFDNKTGKKLKFTLTVEPTSKGPVQLQCWHHLHPIEKYQVQPGEIKYCVTDDSVRIVTYSKEDLSASGSYTINADFSL